MRCLYIDYRHPSFLCIKNKIVKLYVISRLEYATFSLTHTHSKYRGLDIRNIIHRPTISSPNYVQTILYNWLFYFYSTNHYTDTWNNQSEIAKSSYKIRQVVKTYHLSISFPLLLTYHNLIFLPFFCRYLRRAVGACSRGQENDYARTSMFSVPSDNLFPGAGCQGLCFSRYNFVLSFFLSKLS